MKNNGRKITVQSYDDCSSEPTQGLWVHDQKGSLQAVREGNPGQVSKDQHEAKPIVHNVHGGQNSLLLKHNCAWEEVKIKWYYTTDMKIYQIVGFVMMLVTCGGHVSLFLVFYNVE